MMLEVRKEVYSKETSSLFTFVSLRWYPDWIYGGLKEVLYPYGILHLLIARS
jgi:hypothetical protein